MASNETQLEDRLPTMKLYRNGTSSYMGGVGDHERAPRGDIVGWSAAAARRQTQWLWTVDADQLTGSGHAITLTMRDCPPSSMVFVRARDLWTLRVLRMKSDVPSSLSSARTDADRPDCEICRISAARVKWRSSATITKCSSWRSSIQQG